MRQKNMSENIFFWLFFNFFGHIFFDPNMWVKNPKRYIFLFLMGVGGPLKKPIALFLGKEYSKNRFGSKKCFLIQTKAGLAQIKNI